MPKTRIFLVVPPPKTPLFGLCPQLRPPFFAVPGHTPTNLYPEYAPPPPPPGLPSVICWETTFLRTHHSLLAKLVDEDDDEDEVGLKERPEDTRYIQRLHQNKSRSTGSAGKGFDSQLLSLLGAAYSGKCRCVTPEGT